MPVPAFNTVKVTLEFGMGDDAWTESFYRAANAIDITENSAARQLAVKRLLPLVNAARIKGLSVRAVPSVRFGQHIKLNGFVGQETSTRDVAAVTTEVPLFTQNGHKRDYQIHGAADDAHSFDALGHEIPGVGPKMTAFLDYLTLPANGWQMRVQTRAAGDPANLVLTGISVAAGMVSFQVRGAVIVPGQQFIVSNLKGWKMKQFRGTWVCNSSTPDIVGPPFVPATITCFSQRNIDPNFLLARPGQVRITTPAFYVYEQLSRYEALSATASTRKVGRS